MLGVRARPGILAGIIEQKKHEIAALRPQAALFEREAAQRIHQHRPFAEALRQRPAIIAEIKKASPSKGLLRPDFHPAALAQAYQSGGAACISVLTDAPNFQGSLADLAAARAACSLPVLRKDFTIDPIQVFEAAAHGADAVLLIAAILNVEDLIRFRELASSLGMAALVEVHDRDELRKAADSGAQIVGVNNRNLQTFQVSLDVSLNLAAEMPRDAIRVSESGIFSRSHVDLLLEAGFHAFLIGESLMRAGDPVSLLGELTGERQ
jgi:indole-3-glycerol phosphate synthase